MPSKFLCSTFFIDAPTYMTAFLSYRAEEGSDLNHGTCVLIDLVRPLANTDRVIVADSYFASVEAARALFNMGLRFTGTVKTATRSFPMHYLQRVLLPKGKGDHKALLAKDQETGMFMMAFVWADRDRRYFIATCSSSAPGSMIVRQRWRQRDLTANADPEKEQIRIPQTEAGELFYDGCQAIDKHNRVRQDLLNLEKKVQTMSWSNRANHSILGMILVDTYHLAKGCQGSINHLGGARAFFQKLLENLIDNDYDRRTLRRRREESLANEAALTGEAIPELDTTKHLTAPTPTKRRKTKNPNHRAQGRCMVCKVLTSHVCRKCQCFKSANNDKQFWICNKPGKVCMGKHLLEVHTECIAH